MLLKVFSVKKKQFSLRKKLFKLHYNQSSTVNQPSQYSRLTFGQYSFSVPQKKERRSRDVDPFFAYCYHDDNFLHNVIMKIIFSYYYHEDNFLTPTWTLSRLNLSGSKRSGSGKVFGSLSKFFGQFSSEIP